MAYPIPAKIPPCAAKMLARPQWYADPGMVARAKLAPANWFARLLSSPTFAKVKIDAITLCKTIYFRDLDCYDPHTIEGLALLGHELKHVEQYERYGFFSFYFRYLTSYLKGGYGENVPMEAEAYALQRQIDSHLRSEFYANPGRHHCVEMADPHTHNQKFALQISSPFHFDPRN
jgi:hypothetical protein